MYTRLIRTPIAVAASVSDGCAPTAVQVMQVEPTTANAIIRGTAQAERMAGTFKGVGWHEDLGGASYTTQEPEPEAGPQLTSTRELLES